MTTTETKHFGGKRKKVIGTPVPFTLTVYRDDEPEVQHFQLVPERVSGSDMTVLYGKGQRDPGAAATRLVSMLGKLMDDSDGVPYRWEPEALEPDDGRLPLDADEDRQYVVAPGGTVVPADSDVIEAAMKPESGSSRRRWRYLMDEDDEVSVELEDLVEIGQWAITMGAKRPTQPRS